MKETETCFLHVTDRKPQGNILFFVCSSVASTKTNHACQLVGPRMHLLTRT